jgi:hypothetical protein
MNRRLGEVSEGAALEPLRLSLSAAANDRYWEGAGIDHPARRARVLYPPLAANLTILLVQGRVDEALLHTEQRLVCHRGAQAPVDLVVEGRVARRFVKRGRDYAVVEATVTTGAGELLWTSVSTFTPVRP